MKIMLLLCKTVVISVKRQDPVFTDQVLRFFDSRLLLQDLLPDLRRNLNIRMKRLIIGFDRRSFSKFATLQDRRCVIGLKRIFNSHPHPENLPGKGRIRSMVAFQRAYLFQELADEILALLGLFMKNGRKIGVIVRQFPGCPVSFYPVGVNSSQVFQENNKVFCIF